MVNNDRLQVKLTLRQSAGTTFFDAREKSVILLPGTTLRHIKKHKNKRCCVQRYQFTIATRNMDVRIILDKAIFPVLFCLFFNYYRRSHRKYSFLLCFVVICVTPFFVLFPPYEIPEGSLLNLSRFRTFQELNQ